MSSTLNAVVRNFREHDLYDGHGRHEADSNEQGSSQHNDPREHEHARGVCRWTAAATLQLQRDDAQGKQHAACKQPRPIAATSTVRQRAFHATCTQGSGSTITHTVLQRWRQRDGIHNETEQAHTTHDSKSSHQRLGSRFRSTHRWHAAPANGRRA